MKNRWAQGLVVVLVLFLAGTALLVYLAARERVDLVTENYYEKGLAYQGRMDAESRTRRLPARVGVRWTGAGAEVVFPQGTRPDPGKGELGFYRPSDRNMDFAIPLGPDSLGVQRVRTPALVSGYWRVRITWFRDGLEYTHEERLMVP
ncbi:MAG: FixH family protein [Bacteroidota bacterium]